MIFRNKKKGQGSIWTRLKAGDFFRGLSQIKAYTLAEPSNADQFNGVQCLRVFFSNSYHLSSTKEAAEHIKTESIQQCLITASLLLAMNRTDT